MPLMKESGVTHLDTGFESLSEEILKKIKGNRTPDDAILTSMLSLHQKNALTWKSNN